MKASQDQELVALQLIADQRSPVGASRLEAAWRSNGIDKGEATAGRFLRQLDQEGYTELRNRTRGRVLSKAGEARLLELQREVDSSRAQKALRSALDITNLDDLIELLEVRKLVESETARQAALNATPEDVKKLYAIVSVPTTRSNADSTKESMDFHRAVAEASKSPLLIAIMNLLLDSNNDPLELALSQITMASGLSSSLIHDHTSLIHAIELRQAIRATEIMESHFQHLIKAVSQAEELFQNQQSSG